MRAYELPFVAAAWKRSQRFSPPCAPLPDPVYWERANRQFDELTKLPAVVVLVARDPENPDTLFGFGCFESRPPVLALHYMYTRDTHRELGVARALLRHVLARSKWAEQLVYTAGTRFDDLWERYGFERRPLKEWLSGSDNVV